MATIMAMIRFGSFTGFRNANSAHSFILQTNFREIYLVRSF